MQPTPEAPGSHVLGIAPGELIGGRYEVVRVLGVGGTGAVFEARHRAIGRLVAVKFLLPELAANPVVPQRFLQEAQTANEVRHRNIVEVLDFGADAGRLYMVMEYLHGESLADFLVREAPVAPGRMVRLIEPVLGALHAAHLRGIVHRDVKPQNIFLARVDGEDELVPKLIDFGIAKRLVGSDVNLTSTGMILGTPAYMAPEQARADKNVSHLADQYAVGVILYQGLTGRVPYDADTYPAMLIQIVSQPPAEILRYRPDLDRRLAAVVMRCLARDPAQRFPTLLALRDALAPWRDDLTPGGAAPSRPAPPDVPTRPDGTPDASVDPPTIPHGRVTPPISIAPDDAPTIARPAAPSSLPVVAALVGAAALAMVGLAAWLATRPPAAPRPVAAAPDARPPVADDVTFRIDVTPATAEISIDGAVVGAGHAEVVRQRDGRRLQLRLSAPGHAAVTDVLVASADLRISRVLVPLRDPAPPPTPRVDLSPRLLPQVPQPPPRVELPRAHDPAHPRIDPTNPFR